MIKLVGSDDWNIIHPDKWIPDKWIDEEIRQLKLSSQPIDGVTDSVQSRINGIKERNPSIITPALNTLFEEVIRLVSEAEKIYTKNKRAASINLETAITKLDAVKRERFTPLGHAIDDIISPISNALDRLGPTLSSGGPEPQPRSQRSVLRHLRHSIKKGKIDLF